MVEQGWGQSPRNRISAVGTNAKVPDGSPAGESFSGCWCPSLSGLALRYVLGLRRIPAPTVCVRWQHTGDARQAETGIVDQDIADRRAREGAPSQFGEFR
jgi:hypothetical protein